MQMLICRLCPTPTVKWHVHTILDEVQWSNNYETQIGFVNVCRIQCPSRLVVEGNDWFDQSAIMIGPTVDV